MLKSIVGAYFLTFTLQFIDGIEPGNSWLQPNVRWETHDVGINY